MATPATIEKWNRAALEIRKALPEPESLAVSLAGAYGMDWRKLPPKLRDVLFQSCRKSLYAMSGQMAREPELLRRAMEAKREI